MGKVATWEGGSLGALKKGGHAAFERSGGSWGAVGNQNFTSQAASSSGFGSNNGGLTPPRLKSYHHEFNKSRTGHHQHGPSVTNATPASNWTSTNQRGGQWDVHTNSASYSSAPLQSSSRKEHHIECLYVRQMGFSETWLNRGISPVPNNAFPVAYSVAIDLDHVAYMSYISGTDAHYAPTSTSILPAPNPFVPHHSVTLPLPTQSSIDGFQASPNLDSTSNTQLKRPGQASPAPLPPAEIQGDTMTILSPPGATCGRVGQDKNPAAPEKG